MTSVRVWGPIGWLQRQRQLFRGPRQTTIINLCIVYIRCCASVRLWSANKVYFTFHDHDLRKRRTNPLWLHDNDLSKRMINPLWLHDHDLSKRMTNPLWLHDHDLSKRIIIPLWQHDQDLSKRMTNQLWLHAITSVRECPSLYGCMTMTSVREWPTLYDSMTLTHELSKRMRLWPQQSSDPPVVFSSTVNSSSVSSESTRTLIPPFGAIFWKICWVTLLLMFNS